jgi:hypothetical protein
MRSAARPRSPAGPCIRAGISRLNSKFDYNKNAHFYALKDRICYRKTLIVLEKECKPVLLYIHKFDPN